MFGLCYIIHVPILATMMALLLVQSQFFYKCTEAKHYDQQYGGDIMLEDNKHSYLDDLDEHEEPNRYVQPHGHKSKMDFGGKFKSEFATGSVGRRSGEREKVHYKNVNEYNKDNRNVVRNGPNKWIPASSMVEEQQNESLTIEMGEEAPHHKCHIWVPLDALDKYPDAERKQENRVAGSVFIEICCQGYAAMRWRGKTLCRPICENCQNGRCIAPGVCECYDEFVANDNGDCVFTCPLGCQNGRCFLDGSCQCDPGYKLDESRKFCRPICSKGCGSSPLHNCTEPEVCGCIKGYILTDNDCQPVCQPECGSGGKCRQPNVCECNAGYDLKDGVCQTDCYQKCDNGICYTRNRCICNPGFTYHERSTQCIPK